MSLEKWIGEFGDAYHGRQTITIEARMRMWKVIIDLMHRDCPEILEVGAGHGNNLDAIRSCIPGASLAAVEPNENARNSISRSVHRIDGRADCIQSPDESFDMVFTCGVLIHLPRDEILPALREMHRVSRKYIACIEYFAPGPELVPYHDGVPLWRDDYGSLWMDNFDLNLLGHGFFWKRFTGLDNLNWWLFEKVHVDS